MKTSIAFGTNGIRGNANEFPFTKQTLKILGKAIGRWALRRYKKDKPVVLIGCDTRISGERIKNFLTYGLQSIQLKVLDGKILSTPAVCQLVVKEEGIDFGIVVSASHNPYYDNGIKFFSGTKELFCDVDEKNIINNVKLLQKETSRLDNKKTQEEVVDWHDAFSVYKKNIISYFKKGFLKNIRVVLDCAHGATYSIAPMLFRFFGAEVITIASTPNGKNINDSCGTLYPNKLKQAVLDFKANIGFAFDGDGDRVIAVNKDGEIKDGDDIITLLMKLPQYCCMPTVVATIMSNKGFENFVVNDGKQLVRTAVGDKYIVASMKESSLLLGGEASGHVVLWDYLSTGDGVFVALRVLESIILTKNWTMSTFSRTPQVTLNVSIDERDDLSSRPYSDIILEHKRWLDKGRIIVRFSETEKKLRIMAESEDESLTKNVAESLSKKLKLALSKKSLSY
jgi:phosphoglucosamine mutase